MDFKFLLIFWFISLHFNVIRAGSEQKRLLKHLFDPNRPDAHNKLERPVKNDSESVEVRIRVYLIQILDVDEKNQLIQVNLWLYMTWADYHFHWDSKLYDGITQFSVPPDSVWKPDIVLFNSANEKFNAEFNANVRVLNTTWMRWCPTVLYKATCDMDVTWFPFDRQICFLKFGSWTYDRPYIDLRLDCQGKYNPHEHGNCSEKGYIMMSEYKVNGEFKVIDNSIQREEYGYDGENYVSIIVKIGIERLYLYYTFNFIMPCILLSFMAMMVFVLPPESGEKISLGVTVLLSMTMFLLLVADKLPQTSEAVPMISKYFLCIIISCSLSIIFTVIVLNYHHRTESYQAVPIFIRIVINKWLGRILLMRVTKPTTEFKNGLAKRNQRYLTPTDDETNNDMVTTNKVRVSLDNVSCNEILTREWRLAARIIDRLCLIVFTIFTIFATVTFFIKGRQAHIYIH